MGVFRRGLLIVEAVVALALCRTFLWLLPFRRVVALTHMLGGRRRRALEIWSVRFVVAQVERGSSFVPHATCLVRALAARLVLARHGTPSTLRIGVAGSGSNFSAHAWLEAGEQIFFAAEDLEQYRTLITVRSETQQAG
jgi:hypothetical protein